MALSALTTICPHHSLADEFLPQLQHNDFTGPVPVELCALSQLTSLNLYTNRLTGPIPRCLGDLSQLQWLQVRARCSPL